MKVLSMIGTRPEAIKMAPVIRAIAKTGGFEQVVVCTAQHRDLLDQTLSQFGIRGDYDLNLMAPNQGLAEFTGRCFLALDPIFQKEAPDLVIAEGDTSTVFVAAVASFYRRIPFAHVEAGLRTHDLANPFPEEFNRLTAGRLADLHFAPTERARGNLLREGVPDNQIKVTGNTVIDALLQTVDEMGLQKSAGDRQRILVTAHRRENFGRPIRSLCKAIADLLDRYPLLQVVWPVHPNPNISEVVRSTLGRQSRVELCEPFDYRRFVRELNRACIVLTDSGGVQEEAPALSKPVLVLRDTTERPEAVTHGVAKLIGTETERIVSETSKLLDDPTAYAAMAVGSSPYGDGQAAKRIVAAIQERFP